MTETLKVLQVEDSEDDALMIQRHLQRAGYVLYVLRVDTADAFQKTLASDDWDIVLSDYSMPGFDGLAALRILRESGRDIPFIIVSGAVGEEAAVSLMKAGAGDYVSKDRLARLVPAVQREMVDAQVRTERNMVEEAWRQSEERYRSIFENAIEGIFQSNAAGQFVTANPALARMLGYDSSEDLITSIRDIAKQIYVFSDQRAEFVRKIEEEDRVQGFEYLGRCKDGSTIWLSENSRIVRDHNGELLYYEGTIENINERKRSEEIIRTQLDRTTTLYNAAQELSNVLEVQVLADLITRICVDSFGADLAWIGHNEKNMEIKILSAWGQSAQKVLNLKMQPKSEAAGHEMFRILENRNPVVFENIESDERMAPFRHRILEDNFCSVAGFPLVSLDSAFGMLALATSQPRFFTSERMDMIQTFSHQAAAALDNARLLQDSQQRATQLAAINALGRALSETLDLNIIYNLLGESVNRLLPEVSTVFISSYDEASRMLTCRYGQHENQKVNPQDLPSLLLEPPGKGTQSEVVYTRQPLIINDLRKKLVEASQVIKVGDGDEMPTQSGLYVPLLARDRVIGVMQVQSYVLGRFTPADAELLGSVANTAAISIENARLLHETRRRLEQVETLRSIDAAISSSLELGLTLKVVIDQVVAHLGVDAATILLLNPFTQTLEYAAGLGFRNAAIKRTRLNLGQGLAGRAAVEQRMLSISDLHDAGEAFTRAPLAEESFSSYHAAPLISKGQLKGVLELFGRKSFNPDEDWMRFMDTLVHQTAIAIDNATLFRDLQRSNADLMMAYDATIEGWSRAMDLRDKETEGHTQRVTNTTVDLARLMGINETDLVHIRRGAMLHDIGKMGIPDAILLKPGPLTPDEWEIMRRHPDYAYEMLAPIQYLRLALDIPYCHHEKWDGTGYPRRLKEYQIPLAARLFALVDVWDALTSDRPYRNAWSREKAMDYIRSGSGTHFDPQVVELFLQMLQSEGLGG